MMDHRSEGIEGKVGMGTFLRGRKVVESMMWDQRLDQGCRMKLRPESKSETVDLDNYDGRW